MGTVVDWGSHLPVLMYAMENSEGDVLELGSGNFSTPYLHWKCHLQKRNLVSYDDKERFFNDLKLYESETHKTFFVSNWDDIEIERPWGVALVDHHPNTRRKVDIKRLANHARLIVVHDTEEPGYGYDAIYPLFKYRYDFIQTRVHTTVLSNFEDVTIWKL